MVSKKYVAMLGLLCLTQSVFAQSEGTKTLSDTKSYWDDSAKVSTKDMAQYNEFRNNAYAYPAKPRDMWQLGVTGGILVPQFDIPNNAFPGWIAGLNLRKSLGYLVSVKVGAQYGEAKGQEFRYGSSINNLPSDVKAKYTAAGLSDYLPNYKFTTVIPSVELMFSFKNMLFHKGNNKSNVYLTVGYAPVAYHTTMDVLKADGTPYSGSDFSGVNFNGKRKDIQKDIKDALDGSYETDAVVRGRSQNFDKGGNDKWQFRHTAFIGGGYELRLSSRVTLGFEAKYYALGDDYVDGKALGKSSDGASYLTPDKDNLLAGSVTFGFNLGNSSKRTEPKWFQNPLNYLYGEVNEPKHMKMPPVVLPDADGDGVTDQFDQEPNTPAGASVDSHGVAKDTDGDGVPDFKDKELLTPQKCFPVDADGIGKCPPTCCDSLDMLTTRNQCNIGSLAPVQFKGGSSAVSKATQATLTAIAAQIQANPNCKIRVVGHGASDKRAQQLSWDRVNAVIKYFVDKQGIAESRFIFTYGVEGDPNTVDLEGTSEEGPNTVPAPHPQYQKSK